MTKDKILIIDDETGIRSSLKGILEDEGYIIKTTESGEEGLRLLKGENFDILLLDIWLPEMSGIEVLEKVKAIDAIPQVIMITGHGSVETAVRATKLGAYDFLEKPLSLEKVILTVKNALRQKRLEEENIQLRENVKAKFHLIGKSPLIKKLKKQIQTIAPTNGRVLIYGENGTGKELVATLIHQQSQRKNKRFIQINSSAIPDDLIDSQLFGYVKGGPYEAGRVKKGKLLLADSGTLFLDEISDMSLKTQAKLVKFIDENRFEPLGSSDQVFADVRLISATNKDLKELIRKGKFLEDLYYRLNVIPLYTPPLRDRKEDIPLLINYFLRLFCVEYGRKSKKMGKDALEAFLNYAWPGNVSELMNVIERFVIMVKEEEIRSSHLLLLVEPRESQFLPDFNGKQTFDQARERFEKELIQRALTRNHWDLTRTAQELKVGEAQLCEKIKSLSISFLG